MKTHGLSRTPIYRTWASMRGRCCNPKDTEYARYGGRGITVCDRWMTPSNFFEDMFPSWSGGMTIERVDVNGNYEPENCCWIPKSEQPKNRRCCVFIDTPWGNMTLAEASRRVGMSQMAFGRRYNHGWRGDKLFQAPFEKGARITPRVHKKAA